MRIGVIQASSQREKNPLIYECTRRAAKGHEVVNFGVGWPPEEAERKRGDTLLLKELNGVTKRDMAECLGRYPRGLVEKAMGRENVADYIKRFGKGPVMELWGL